VIRGAIDQGRFSVFYYRDASLTAVDSIKRPGDQMIAPSRLAAGGDGDSSRHCGLLDTIRISNTCSLCASRRFGRNQGIGTNYCSILRQTLPK